MYSDEKVAQIIVSLLKKHGIRKVIASPGNTNFGIVGSMQSDSFFEVYSAVDERSAGYMACGLAESSGERVVLTCTGATASRNYLPGLTEAYYRKLPIIAVTSFNGTYNVGQLLPQCIDRSSIQNDIALYSVDLPLAKDAEDERFINRVVNEAILESARRGGGPVHINVTADYSHGHFNTRTLPEQRVITRYTVFDELPAIDDSARIAVFVGAHRVLSQDEIEAIGSFALSRNAAVFVDHTSNYHGPRSINVVLAAENTHKWTSGYASYVPDLIIDMGEVSGDYVTVGFLKGCAAPAWRVSPDGEIRDRFGSLNSVFEMPAEAFFSRYSEERQVPGDYFNHWKNRQEEMVQAVPELPFTNRWIARQLGSQLPEASVLHMSILNSLRSWNYVDLDNSIDCYCNTGGFGIDGCLSTAVGYALDSPSRLNIVAIGDLAFFYDMNALGNRHVPANIRIVLVNNSLGVEFRMPYSPAATMGDEVRAFVAAEGHFKPRTDWGGNANMTLAEGWCSALGIRYYRASNKEEFKAAVKPLLDPSVGAPVMLECIVNSDDEVAAAETLAMLDASDTTKNKAVNFAKRILPANAKDAIKKIIK